MHRGFSSLLLLLQIACRAISYWRRRKARERRGQFARFAGSQVFLQRCVDLPLDAVPLAALFDNSVREHPGRAEAAGMLAASAAVAKELLPLTTDL